LNINSEEYVVLNAEMATEAYHPLYNDEQKKIISKQICEVYSITCHQHKVGTLLFFKLKVNYWDK